MPFLCKIENRERPDSITSRFLSGKQAGNKKPSRKLTLSHAFLREVHSATSVKKTLLAALNYKLVPYLTAVSTLESYKTFVSKCEAEIAKANATVSGRAKTSAKAE